MFRRAVGNGLSIMRNLQILQALRAGKSCPCVYYSTKKSSSSQYVVNRVKTYDYETYLLLLLSPKGWRYPMFAVNAYNVELSLVLESASEMKTSASRFAFWHDALERIFSGERPYDHPVIQELDRLHRLGLINSQQSKKSLLQMLKSREQISSVTHIETLTQLETYAEHTRSSLLYLALALSGHTSVDTDHAASHAGRCSGLVTALRATPYLTSRNQLLLPQDILSLHGVSQTDVLRGRENVKEAVYDIASQAHTHLEKAKALIKKLPAEARSCFLSTAICEHQLGLLRKLDFNVFNPDFQKKNSLLAWKLWRARRKL